ncbi:MAG: Holliday junction branch migration protein RuvA [Phycisphaerae bacterium]|nr:Holliday junction branch migration protein RuvA [Phycisphaerae bacterium]
MIARIDGELEGMSSGAALVRVGAIVYEVLVPAFDQMRLAASVGEAVSFHTLHYLEGQGQGSSFWPRLIGFSTPAERAFFEMFTTVKGIGNKKALRSLQLPIATVAEAIANRDVATLQSLPEIGRKTAEAIILELKEKANRFLGSMAISEGKPVDRPTSRLRTDAISVLVQLGEPRPFALVLVERALTADPAIDSANDLVTASLRLKDLA